ncbi:hypothetical protein DTO212C5_3310 [Paecilomyces variotii]|nr:hypothetical protein DTO212C5_3310 [Paecilomyces variotii]
MPNEREPPIQIAMTMKSILNDLPIEVIDMICESLSPLYLKQFRLTNRKYAQLTTRHLFRKLYITFCTDSYNNVIRISKDEKLRTFVHEIIWDLREIQGSLTNEFEFMLHFGLALYPLDHVQCRAFQDVHAQLYKAQSALKTQLSKDTDSHVKRLREALQRFSIEKCSTIQSEWDMATIPLSLRLESGMLYKYGTWALPFYLLSKRAPSQYAVGRWPIKVALQCLMPCKELSILAYSGNCNAINMLLARGSHLRSSLPHVQRLDITLFSPHPPPYNWHDRGEPEMDMKAWDLNRYCTKLESLNLRFKDCSESGSPFGGKATGFGVRITMVPIKEAYFPNLRVLTVQGFGISVPDFTVFLRRHSSTLRTVSVKKTLFMLGYVGEILDTMRETQMQIESGCFDDVMDNSWLHVTFGSSVTFGSRLTVREDQLIDYVVGNGPNPCPIPRRDFGGIYIP